eukprot:gene1048-2629_t
MTMEPSMLADSGMGLGQELGEWRQFPSVSSERAAGFTGLAFDTIHELCWVAYEDGLVASYYPLAREDGYLEVQSMGWMKYSSFFPAAPGCKTHQMSAEPYGLLALTDDGVNVFSRGGVPPGALYPRTALAPLACIPHPGHGGQMGWCCVPGGVSYARPARPPLPPAAQAALLAEDADGCSLLAGLTCFGFLGNPSPHSRMWAGGAGKALVAYDLAATKCVGSYLDSYGTVKIASTYDSPPHPKAVALRGSGPRWMHCLPLALCLPHAACGPLPVISCSNTLVACASPKGRISVRDPVTMREEHFFQSHAEGFTDLDTGQSLIYTCGYHVGPMGNYNSCIKVWDLRNLAAEVCRISSTVGNPVLMLTHPTVDTMLAVVEEPCCLTFYDTVTQQPTCTPFMIGAQGVPIHMAISSSQEAIGVADSEGFGHVVGPDKGSMVVTINHMSEPLVMPTMPSADGVVEGIDLEAYIVTEETPYSIVPFPDPSDITPLSAWPPQNYVIQRGAAPKYLNAAFKAELTYGRNGK